MKTFIKIYVIFFIFLTLLSCCTDSSSAITEDVIVDEEKPESAYHNKIRNKPFPTKENGIYINPIPLLVPQKLKKNDYLQFQLSQDKSFQSPKTITSSPAPWCMFNPHQELLDGLWYWRFRSVSKDGAAEEWGEIYEFEVSTNIPKFLTPTFDKFEKNIPQIFPRLYTFLDPSIEEARKNVTAHPEYKSLLGRANEALKADFSNGNPYKEISRIKNYSIQLYQAYHLTQNEQYRNKLIEFANLLLATPLSDSELFSSNFFSTDVALVYLKAYDIANEIISQASKLEIEAVLYKIASRYYSQYCGYQENHIFDNHFWQHNMRILFQCALVLNSQAKYQQHTLEMLEYYYELWTARAPDSGFNRDGLVINGATYLESNVKTLYYMPMLFSYLTQENFLDHLWYKNAGKALAFSWPPNSKSTGFGDGSELAESPNRLRVAFADFLARELEDSYSSWYVNECKEELFKDYEFRLYRMASNKSYPNSTLPYRQNKLLWNKDAGEVMMHSNLSSTEKNLSLAFRSSIFGSGSHNLSDQNSFNLLYQGKDVYRNTGYYLNFSDKHNITSYRHTRAHNTVLVDGIGQSFSTEAYGNIARAIDGGSISYALGDASHAYRKITDDKMWVDAFKKAGVTQTPKDGFGETALTHYRRHIFMLHPDNIVLLYDELEAKQNVTFDWLLHSPVKFFINDHSHRLETRTKDNSFRSVAQIFSDNTFVMSQTDQFVTPPATTDQVKYPNQWHMTAKFAPSSKARVLTIIQILENGQIEKVIAKNGVILKIGNWEISATLDVAEEASILVENKINNVVFSYKKANPIIEGKEYTRKYKNSSLLYDEIDGRYQVVEQIDYMPLSTRVLK